MSYKITLSISTFLFVALSSCKNYYNEMIHWTSSIPRGTSIDSIKNIQPDFLEIDWNDPEIYESETRYSITKIKNNRDILQMANYLSFVDNKYVGRFAHK